MREYALQQTAILLRRLAFQVNRAAKNRGADDIHDLRVAIRRALFSPMVIVGCMARRSLVPGVFV